MTQLRTIAPTALPNAPSFISSLILCPPPPTTASLCRLHHDHQHALFQQKRILRFRVKKDLKSMDHILRSQENDVIQKVIFEAPWFKSCRRLCAYISCSALREVDTSKALFEVLRNPTKDSHSPTGEKLYVPRVEDNNRHMRMLHISGIDDLIANSMHILEPAPVDANGNDRDNLMLKDPVDLFLLPVALSYSLQILEEEVIPLTPNAVFIDALVTPSGAIPISPAAKGRCP